MNFVEKALKYKQVTLTVLFLFLVVGVYSLFNMSRREDPQITVPQGLVIAFYPGASSVQVEEQVTKKLEESLFRFEEVKKAKTVSSSEEGKVVITVELNDNVKQPDVFWSKLRQQLMLTKQTDLPDGVIGPIVNSDFGDTEAMILGISGTDIPYDQLKQYAQRLENLLRTIPTVSKIKRSGDIDEQILVTANSAQLAQYGIKLQDVMKILQSQNDIYPTGNIELSTFQVPLYTKGFYATQGELANQIIGSSSTGSIIRLKDVATFSRTYADPTSKIKVNDDYALIVSIQMLPGNNIVKFGDSVNEKLAQFRKTIPSNINITTIADQPKVVDHNISHFISEFFVAIIAVVIVILLLLPFRIAMVAATAIPMTIALTLALMNVFGIELHQVSLAALIVVLGMVVDDAIVVADNYLELLDKGMSRWEAAWKSASELVIPIFVATITIVFAFMPMVMLSGVVGEFIRTLPLTVTIALVSSFLVAMVLTPLLCYTFIKKGLHSPDEATKKKDNFLDKMQSGYDRLLDWCIARPKLTISLSIAPLVLALLLYKFGIKQQFFPAAERNQFVVELWMPTGTNLDATENAIQKLEDLVKYDERVLDYATFIGTSAPRFYYNFSPEVPVTNYAQIMLNTTDVEAAESLAGELSRKVEAAVPEGSAQVRLMQQGKPLKAPVEVQIYGENIAFLKEIGQQVGAILKSKEGSAYVRDDFKEDYYGLDIQLKPEAERLGFTTEAVAKSVYAGFSGAPVTTIREGNNAVKVVFRLDENSRQSASDIGKVYLSSPVTGANVPLEQIAELNPVWRTGRIMHRNGLRSLTVQSETQGGVLPSQLLKAIQPEISALDLPIGYSISYGGEDANQKETFSEMMLVLGISLLLIFFTLLFQLNNLKETGIVMLTIPLSLFGALVGLWVTGNNFGFTAFVGLISLTGVVVRNAIILIDHIHELVKHNGMDLRTATIESGKRRLRPIFLTAMASAIGVMPMILSGSPMWSPLASVIAFGVVWGMLIALLSVPVFYMSWIVPNSEKTKNQIDEQAI
ncbi:multidrug efflux pump subunit AcrB [Algoriphagus sp. 4150]|uniref:efflux RND transporter permease subunit n=1 Tax=Algoriphagus sp. 4150 TaxID=2817756 RepID=UPI002855E15E|nr:efflux RND transporter permease subunit [Algoriphagus sp. 4150]MDR7132453.1 multidrug efflux pump subunit AcrB [Algoriphagus sp. 4150]